jgi:photosystem II stability/assembly factor-like uncharacterized protein
MYNKAMKRNLSLVILIATSLVLSGCSFGSGFSLPSSNKPVTLSESLWRTTDGGKDWVVSNKVNGKARASDIDALSIALNPSDSRVIFVGLKDGGIIKSEDAGDTWTFLSNFTSPKVYGLAIDPLNNRVIYASGVLNNRGKIWKTEDFGESWKEIYTSPSDGPLVISLILNEKNSQIIYATISDKQIIKSLDGGNSWKNLYKANQLVFGTAIDKVNSDLVYFMVMDGTLLRSRDGGNTIENIRKNYTSSAALGQGFTVVETDPVSANTVYIAGKGGLLKSIDAGNTWNKIKVLSDPSVSPITALAINPRNNREITYGAGQATYKSIDGGVNWATSQFDIKKRIRFIKYDPTNPSNIYMGFNK